MINKILCSIRNKLNYYFKPINEEVIGTVKRCEYVKSWPAIAPDAPSFGNYFDTTILGDDEIMYDCMLTQGLMENDRVKMWMRWSSQNERDSRMKRCSIRWAPVEKYEVLGGD